jgi:trehalose 6-phosphate phosphatase
MKKLFTPDSLRILESLSFTQTLYAFDFDGTLSKIVRNPQDATIRDGTDTLLRELAKHAPVAIISGRSVADLTSHLKFIPPHLIGNHGLEGLGTRPDTLETAHATCREWRSYLEKHLPTTYLKTGLEVEDKSYSLAVHYRKCAAKKLIKLDILKVAANLTPRPRIILGKCVVNLLPPGAPHKGVALVELMLQTGIKSAFYIGDDDTDEDVFSLPNARIFTVRVGRKLNSQAQFFIEDQTEIDRTLKAVLHFFSSISSKSESLKERKSVANGAS